MSDSTGEHLHDRATRGETLSAAEEEQLKAWYLEQDAAEAAALNLNSEPKSVLSLRGHVDSALAEIVDITTKIQKVTAENDALRRDNAKLRLQLDRQSAAQST